MVSSSACVCSAGPVSRYNCDVPTTHLIRSCVEPSTMMFEMAYKIRWTTEQVQQLLTVCKQSVNSLQTVYRLFTDQSLCCSTVRANELKNNGYTHTYRCVNKKILDDLLLVRRDLRVGEDYVCVNPSLHKQMLSNKTCHTTLVYSITSVTWFLQLLDNDRVSVAAGVSCVAQVHPVVFSCRLWPHLVGPAHLTWQQVRSAPRGVLMI